MSPPSLFVHVFTSLCAAASCTVSARPCNTSWYEQSVVSEFLTYLFGHLHSIKLLYNNVSCAHYFLPCLCTQQAHTILSSFITLRVLAGLDVCFSHGDCALPSLFCTCHFAKQPLASQIQPNFQSFTVSLRIQSDSLEFASFCYARFGWVLSVLCCSLVVTLPHMCARDVILVHVCMCLHHVRCRSDCAALLCLWSGTLPGNGPVPPFGAVSNHVSRRCRI